MINSQWLELLMSRTNFHGPKMFEPLKFDCICVCGWVSFSLLLFYYCSVASDLGQYCLPVFYETLGLNKNIYSNVNRFGQHQWYRGSLRRSIYYTRGVWLVLVLSCFVKTSELLANSVDPDETSRSVASDLGLHFLPVSLLWDARFKYKWIDLDNTSSA